MLIVETVQRELLWLDEGDVARRRVRAFRCLANHFGAMLDA
jgi:hypothetical protein